MCLAWASCYSDQGTASVPMVAGRVLRAVDDIDYGTLYAAVKEA